MKHTTTASKVKYIVAAAAVAGASILTPTLVTAKKDGTNITICHATSSEKNPYVQKSVDPQGVINGHLGHDRDIVPIFTYGGVTYSQNWDRVGIDTFENGCVPVPEIRD